ncbi:hypothetical protein CL617_01850 [archaeon]|nr:hypothetical protein [archaeon]|tara:strand:- start:11260 stop:11826 length:567 start_codon:yes stop_codon:yes gene_type:complete
MTHKEIFDDVKDSINYEDLEKEKPKIFKKIFTVTVSILLIVLILSYFLTNSTIRSVAIGLFESSKIEDSIVEINKTSSLIFEDNTYNQLLIIYNNNPDLEFKVCLKGLIKDNNYLINEIFTPKTYLQTPNKVIADPCPKDSLVDMHSHPLRHCLPSEQDFISFSSFKKKNNNAIMAVLCEKGRFNFYS